MVKLECNLEEIYRISKSMILNQKDKEYFGFYEQNTERDN